MRGFEEIFLILETELSESTLKLLEALDAFSAKSNSLWSTKMFISSVILNWHTELNINVCTRE